MTQRQKFRLQLKIPDNETRNPQNQAHHSKISMRSLATQQREMPSRSDIASSPMTPYLNLNQN